MSESPTILLVDDDPGALQLYGDYIESYGYKLLRQDSGERLIEYIADHKPSLIVLDLHLPNVDGLAMLERIKSSSETSDLPVIIITMDSDADLIEKCFNLGAADFVSKPVARVVLQARIRYALETANRITRLKQLNKQMSEFVGIVAHDLRNPLATLKAMVELMSPMDEPYDELVERMSKISILVNDLVTDLLDLTAMETGRIKLNIKDTELKPLFTKIILDNEMIANRKNIRLINECPDRIFVKADAKRMSQIISNLCSNAVKFSPRGESVTLGAEDLGNSVRVSVKDNGVGIPQDIQSDLFLKHKKVSSKGTEGEVGTGFGLPLSQELVIAHGSRIEIESREGEGSTFSFILPRC